MRCTYPVNCTFYLPAFKAVSALCLRIVGTSYFCNFPIFIHIIACAGNKISIHKPYFIAWEESEIFLRRIYHKVLTLYVKLSCKCQLSAAKSLIFKVMRSIQPLCLTLRVISYYKLNRVKYSHNALLLKFKSLSYTVLKHGIVRRCIALGHA